VPRFIMGIGIACFFVPLNQVILSGLKPEEIASASGLSNFFRTIAASFSTAVTVTIWQHRGEYHHAVLAEHLTDASPATQSYLDHLQAMGASASRAWALIDGVVTRESLTLAVNDVFLLCAALFLLMIPVIWMARPPFGNAGAVNVH
jgi:DHA2 family multidrug resistance protein